MNTAVDSSVIMAIVKGEPVAEAWMNRLMAARKVGSLLACETVWAETRQLYHTREEHARVMEGLGLLYSPLSAVAAVLAGEMQTAYRQAGGQRERLLADFLIGAHACVQAGQLATCDDGFARKYFRDLKIVEL